MDNRPIGIFDSGLGGLTAVKEMEQLMPNEDIIYFGDTGRVPYGTKSPEIVTQYSEQIISFLKKKNVKAILAACGTVSSTAGAVGRSSGVPYFDVITPTAAEASRLTKNNRIGVIATTTTINSGSYKKALGEISEKNTVFDIACPMFVSLVENGYIEPGDPVTRLVAERSLAELKTKGIDTLILGCTHFPIISETISDVMGKDITLINSGKEAAKAVCSYLKENSMEKDNGNPVEHSFYVSDSTESFCSLAGIFLGHSVKGVTKRINLEEY